jgi:hypothetical protein
LGFCAFLRQNRLAHDIHLNRANGQTGRGILAAKKRKKRKGGEALGFGL